MRSRSTLVPPPYLNCGFAYRQNGNFDQAIADLGRAIRYALGAVRGYYHRSLMLREKGDDKRADRGQKRTVALDFHYIVVLEDK